jgi:aquaporin Z
VLREWIAHPSVNYVVTRPGRYGELWAFVAELMMALILMSVILWVSNTRALNRYTGMFAGTLVMIYISVEAPISGMSLNPARTFGSAFAAQVWSRIWIYFTAPPIGMLLAAELYLRLRGRDRILCAKLHHENTERCIFHCNYR